MGATQTTLYLAATRAGAPPATNSKSDKKNATNLIKKLKIFSASQGQNSSSAPLRKVPQLRLWGWQRRRPHV